MLVFGVLAFAMVVFFVSFLIGSTENGERGRIALYTTLIAWGSLLCGLYMARL
jgi:hypothetical protein